MFTRLLAISLSCCLAFEPVSTASCASISFGAAENVFMQEVENEASEEQTKEVAETEVIEKETETVTETAETEEETETVTETAETEEETETVTETAETEEETETVTETAETEEETEIVTETAETEEETETVTETAEIEEETETVETEEVSVEEPLLDSDAVDKEAIALTLNTSVSFDFLDAKSVWYSFVVPEDGYYNFHSDGTTKSTKAAWYREGSESSLNSVTFSTEGANLQIKAAKGETVYLYLTSGYYNSNAIVEFKVHKLDEVMLTTGSNGYYQADMEDCTIMFKPETGYGHIRMSAYMNPKEGAVLPDYYMLSCYYSNSYESSFKVKVYSDSSNELSMYQQVNQGTEYTLKFLLLDKDGKTPIAIFRSASEDMKMTTKSTDAPLVVHGVETTHNQAIVDVEVLDPSVVSRCYYVPTDGSAAEQNEILTMGWDKRTYSELLPSKEYKFTFTNTNGVSLYEMTAATEKDPVKIKFSAEASNGKIEPIINLKADVTDYIDSNDYTYFYCRYTNIFGDVVDFKNEHSISAGESADGKRSFQLEQELSAGLQADTEYELEVWLTSKGWESEHEILKVKTPEAVYTEDQIIFTVENNADNPGTVDCKVQITDDTAGFQGKLYYWRTDNEYSKSNYRTLYVSKGEGKLSVSGLQKGCEYKFTALIKGIKKEVIFRTSGEEEIKLVPVTNAENRNTAYGVIRTFKLETEKGVLPTEGKYNLSLHYWREDWGTYDFIQGYGLGLNKANEYQGTFISTKGEVLEPGKTYNLQWVLTDLTGTTKKYYYFYETVELPNPDLQLTTLGSSYNYLKYGVSLGERDKENVTDTLFIYTWIKEEGMSYRTKDFVYLSVDYDYSDTLEFMELKPNTNYTVSFRSKNSNDPSEYIEYKQINFTTPEDDRQVIIENIEPKMYGADINYTLKGVVQKQPGYVHCYIREKGTEEWRKVGYNNFNLLSNTISFDSYWYQKENTTYEYLIGFSDSKNITAETLEKTTTGEFTTLADKRCLSEPEIKPGYKQVTIETDFSGNEQEISSYVHCYLKEKGSTQWLRNDCINVSNFWEKKCSFTYTWLQPDTEYEYAIIVADTHVNKGTEMINNASVKKLGSFKTKGNSFQFSYTVNEEKITNNKAVIHVKAEDTSEDKANEHALYIKMTLKDNQNNTNVRWCILKKGEEYETEVEFINLSANTTYYMSEVAVYVHENNDDIEIGKLTYENDVCSFTTKVPEIPESISLSKDTLNLNISSTGKGISYETLEAFTEPQSAAEEVVWNSSNPNVAVVGTDGKVTAVGTGTAVITVASAYDESVSATCNVTVKSYVAGYQDEDGTSDYTGETFHLYKGKEVSGFGYYEKDENGKLELLTDYTVTPMKQGIVSCEDGIIKGIAAGKTGIILEKDGVKAVFYVDVCAQGKGFGIVDFTSSDSNYPAIKEEDGSYTMAYTEGITYTAVGEISPKQTFQPEDFTWSLTEEEENTAEVSSSGVITVKKPGTVILNVKPKEEAVYLQDEVNITLHFKEKAEEGTGSAIYVLTNLNKKLKNIAFPEDWGEGWSWKYPETPLVINGVNQKSYAFEAVYNGTENYPGEATIPIYIGQITGMSVKEISSSTVKHNQVLTAGGTDELILSVTPVYRGRIDSASLTVEIPAVKGLTITEQEDGGFKVTASKTGNYTLKPVIKVGEKTIVKGTYKIKVVKNSQVVSLSPELAQSVKGLEFYRGSITVEDLDNIAKKEFIVNVTVKDRDGKESDTALQWKSSDSSIVTVKPVSSKNTHSVKITLKKAGKATITATAKDTAKYTANYPVNIYDYEPKISTDKVTVNAAYDYESQGGMELAAEKSSLEIVPTSINAINFVGIFDSKGEKSTVFEIEKDSDNKYFIKLNGKASTGNHKCIVRVFTDRQNYDFPLKISVVNNKPKVKASMTDSVNLFYTNDKGIIQLSMTADTVIESMQWNSKAIDGQSGEFILTPSNIKQVSGSQTKTQISVSQSQDLEVADQTLKNPEVAQGTLTIKLKGYKDTYTFNNFKIKYNYKKPVIVTKSASTEVMTDAGSIGNSFKLYNKTDKEYLLCNYSAEDTIYNFTRMTCDCSDVDYAMYVGTSWVLYKYYGNEKSQKVTFTVDSMNWREAVQTTHTIKNITPKACLSDASLEINTNVKSQVSTTIYLKNNKSVDCSDVVIKGADKKSQKLLDEDLLVMTSSEDDSDTIIARVNRAELMEKKIANGTYTYKVTPYYTSETTGEKTAFGTLTLKVKLTNKPMTAKVTTKGTIDLTKSGVWSVNNSVVVNCKFSNVCDNYTIVCDNYTIDSYKLVGEYSNYFSMEEDNGVTYICESEKANLKAGQSYRLAVCYTLIMENGDTVNVTSNTFTIKPKQTAPKIKITNNNQILYQSIASLTRTYTLEVPKGYTISSVYGSLDINKDGKSDIYVDGDDKNPVVKINDPYAVTATKSGKTYKIPVTVKLTGRDGISKDVKITISVKVKL